MYQIVDVTQQHNAANAQFSTLERTLSEEFGDTLDEDLLVEFPTHFKHRMQSKRDTLSMDPTKKPQQGDRQQSSSHQQNAPQWMSILLANTNGNTKIRAMHLERFLDDLESLSGIKRVVSVSHKKVMVQLTDSTELHDAALEELANHHLVHWIEPFHFNQMHNKDARWISTTGNPSTALSFTQLLNGDGEVVGVGDSGLDSNNCFFYDDNHPVPHHQGPGPWNFDANHRKIKGYHTLIDSVAEDGAHGTHVSGTIVGESFNTQTLNGSSLSQYNGVASGAKVAFMDIGCTRPGGCQCSPGVPCECDLYGNSTCPQSDRSVYPPLDLDTSYFSYFYASGARVSSHSWGGGSGLLGYSQSSMEIDAFAWKNKDFLILFSAGNSADDYGYASLGSQAEAKNAISVGASMNVLENFLFAARYIADYDEKSLFYGNYFFNSHKCADVLKQDKSTCQTYSADMVEFCSFLKYNLTSEEACCSQDFSACKTDNTTCGCTTIMFNVPLSQYCCGKCAVKRFQSISSVFAYSHQNLAYFSSQGPTVDGRVKPDLVNTGHAIQSAKAHNTLENPFVCPLHTDESLLNKQLMSMSGTSMSTPHTAGNALLVREYFVKGFYPSGGPISSDGFSPSSALTKAILIQSTQPLQGTLDTRYGMYPVNVMSPDQGLFLNSKYLEGYGRVQLDSALHITGVTSRPLFVMRDIHNSRQDPTLKTGQAHNLCFSLPDRSTNLKITLVWTDYPSTPSSKKHLVNDLDVLLKLVDQKTVIAGNSDLVAPASRINRDSSNNVEQIWLKDADQGEYVVRIEGRSIYTGEQPFSLVINGAHIVKQCGKEVTEDWFYDREEAPTPQPDCPKQDPIIYTDSVLFTLTLMSFLVLLGLLLFVSTVSLLSCVMLFTLSGYKLGKEQEEEQEGNPEHADIMELENQNESESGESQ